MTAGSPAVFARPKPLTVLPKTPILRRKVARRWPLAEVAFFQGAMARGKMSLKKAVYVVLICAGYAYAAFWTAFFVHAIIAEH
jgi:hypothetical protein